MESIYNTVKQRAGVPAAAPSSGGAAVVHGLVPLSLAGPNLSPVALTWALTGEQWRPETAALRLASEFGPVLPNHQGLEKEIRQTLGHVLGQWQPIGTGEALVDIEVRS